MPEHTRPIRKEICLNESEWNFIQHKRRRLGTRNFGAYARKMLLDGYIIKVDYTEQKSWPLPSIALHRMSIRFAAGSTAQGISMRIMFPN